MIPTDMTPRSDKYELTKIAVRKHNLRCNNSEELKSKTCSNIQNGDKKK